MNDPAIERDSATLDSPAPITRRSYIRHPTVRVHDVVELDSDTSESAGHVDFCHPLQIRYPIERTPSLPVHPLMRVVSAEEGNEITSRVGGSSRPGVSHIRDLNCVISGALKSETLEYVNLLRRDFSVKALDELVRAGDKLVAVFEALEDAAWQIQEYNFRSIEAVRIQIERRRRMFPAISKQVIEIATFRVAPEYTGQENPLSRASGLP